MAIIGKINDEVLIDDAVLRKPKTFTRWIDPTIKEKDKEIERLKNGYCELKVKCNNGECDCTNEEYDGMVENNMKLSLEVERLNKQYDLMEQSLDEKQEVIDKAIHYIEAQSKFVEGCDVYRICNKDVLLSILKGER